LTGTVPAVTVPTPRLIGRDTELRQLCAAVDNGHNRRGETVFLLGEAGIGKSRLVTETTAWAQLQGMPVLRGRASITGPAAPLRPLTEALFSLTRTGCLAPDQTLAPYRGALARLLPEWRDAGQQRVDGSLLLVAEGLLRLLARSGEANGVLLVLEDLHDADRETLAVIDYLSDNLETLPVTMVITARTDASPALDLAMGTGRRHGHSVLELNRLTFAEVAEQVAACLGVPVTSVPNATVQRAFQLSDGVPFVVEELLASWATNRNPVLGAAGRLVGDAPDTTVPETIVFGVVDRVRRLGAEAELVLRAAAVLGNRFSLPIVKYMRGIEDGPLLDLMRGAIAARLVTAHRRLPDWYVFRHPLTADALLSRVQPAERAALARRAAVAIVVCHPGVPGQWCSLAAELYADAGELLLARRMFSRAGGRALAEGAAVSAAPLLRRAHDLFDSTAAVGYDRDERATVVMALAHALTLSETGQMDQVHALLDSVDCAGLRADNRLELHAFHALLARRAGLWSRGAEVIDAARELIGTAPQLDRTARFDVLAAGLHTEQSGACHRVEAEKLATRALAVAEPAGLAVVACGALDILGTVARHRDLTASDACFHRMGTLAGADGNPLGALRARAQSGLNLLLRHGDLEPLRGVYAEVLRVGAVTEGRLIEVGMATGLVLRGEFVEAAELIDRCLPAVGRSGFQYGVRYLQLAKAALHAHQGQRAEMAETISRLTGRRDQHAGRSALISGLCEAMCALLEDNRGIAAAALDRAEADAADSPVGAPPLRFDGLRLLLDVLDGKAGRPEHTAASSAPSAQLAWNKQFLDLADAVLLGRAGRVRRANVAVAAATGPTNPFTMTRQLCLRLGAEAALADGWGDPVGWLRTAENYFHALGVTAQENACRRLLRQAGVAVSARRAGTEQLPAEVRARGITVREYEVLRLIADRLNNTQIGCRLYISPRTVEKHVASLVGKTAKPNRAALADFAAGLVATGGAPTTVG
jgi:DNA-binding CsgD family transcriptional regulator